MHVVIAFPPRPTIDATHFIIPAHCVSFFTTKLWFTHLVLLLLKILSFAFAVGQVGQALDKLDARRNCNDNFPNFPEFDFGYCPWHLAIRQICIQEKNLLSLFSIQFIRRNAGHCARHSMEHSMLLPHTLWLRRSSKCCQFVFRVPLLPFNVITCFNGIHKQKAAYSAHVPQRDFYLNLNTSAVRCKHSVQPEMRICPKCQRSLQAVEFICNTHRI